MKYFSPSYWLKMWVLSAPLFNDKTQGIYAKSINNKNIKDWASENTKSITVLEQQESNFTNSTEFLNYQTHLDSQNWAKNLSLDTSTDSSWNLEARPKNDQQATLWEHEFEEQHHHDLQAEHNRHKRQPNPNRPEPNWQYNLNTGTIGQLRNTYCGLSVIEGIFRFILTQNEGIHDELRIENRLRVYMRDNPLTPEQRAHNQNTDQFQQYLVARFNLNCADINIENWGLRVSQVIEIIDELLQHNRYTIQWFTPIRYEANTNNQNPENEEILNRWRNINWEHQTEKEQLRMWQNNVVTPSWNRISLAPRPVANRPFNEELFFEPFFRTIFFDYLYSSITASLRNNHPAIFLFNFLPSNIEFSGATMGHYVLINAVEIDNGNNRAEIRYRISDPWTGVDEILTARDLYYRGGASFYMIADDDNINHDFDVPRLNTRRSQFVENLVGPQLESITETLWEIINNPFLLLYTFVSPFGNYINCNNRPRREIIVEDWNKKFCDLNPQIDKIKGEITAIKIIDENTKGGNFKPGDIYIGTSNGVYCFTEGKYINKFYDLNFTIASITLDGNGSAYVTNKQSEIYHLDLHGLGSKKVKADNITLAEFENLISKWNKFVNQKNRDFGQITVIIKLQQASKDKELKAGDMFVNVEKEGNGYFVCNDNRFIQTSNIYYEITSLNFIKRGDLYVSTQKEEVYFLDTSTVKNYGFITGIELKNIESSDLNKELKLYYNNDKWNEEIDYKWWNHNYYRCKVVKNFNLGKIIPISNYKKIEFLGENEWFIKTKVSWGEKPYYSDYLINKFNGWNLADLIINKKIEYSSDDFEEIPNYLKMTLQPYATRRYGSAWLDIYQGVGVTFYWEKNNWNLQVITGQYGHSGGSSSGGMCKIVLGNGIRLYNDDTNTRNKRNVFDISKLDEKTYNNKTIVVNELQNTTQWDKNISNLINHEQDLPAINNQSSYANNNVTVGV